MPIKSKETRKLVQGNESLVESTSSNKGAFTSKPFSFECTEELCTVGKTHYSTIEIS